MAESLQSATVEPLVVGLAVGLGAAAWSWGWCSAWPWSTGSPTASRWARRSGRRRSTSRRSPRPVSSQRTPRSRAQQHDEHDHAAEPVDARGLRSHRVQHRAHGRDATGRTARSGGSVRGCRATCRPHRCTQPLLAWYADRARDLPWRRPDRDAWGVLVSEVMLQQTPVDRVVPAWEAWLRRWPDARGLAADSPGEAVRMWGRLGYPRRALRLHAAAGGVRRAVRRRGAVGVRRPAVAARRRRLHGGGGAGLRLRAPRGGARHQRAPRPRARARRRGAPAGRR